MDARRRTGFVACLLAAASCGCADGQSPGAVNVGGRRLPALEAGFAGRAGDVAASVGARVHAGGFEVVGDSAYARAIVEAGMPEAPDGWHGQVRVSAGCSREDCLHWIAESDDGLRRIEVLPVVHDSETRNTTPDIVHHEGGKVRQRLESVQWQMFPGVAEGRHEAVVQEDDGYSGGTTSGMLSLDHAREGIRLRSVIEVRASPPERWPDTGDARDEPWLMGRTTIDLELRTTVYTAPAAGFDLRDMAAIAAGFGINRSRQQPEPGPRVNCDPSLGATDPACASVMGWISGQDDPAKDVPPVDGDW